MIESIRRVRLRAQRVSTAEKIHQGLEASKGDLGATKVSLGNPIAKIRRNGHKVLLRLTERGVAITVLEPWNDRHIELDSYDIDGVAQKVRDVAGSHVRVQKR